MMADTISSGDLLMVQDSGKQQILSAQLRLLYANVHLGIAVSILVATTLAAFQWNVISKPLVAAWWFYMTLVALVRLAIARRYAKASTVRADLRHWLNASLTGIALTSAGWAVAGILLYPPAYLTNQLVLLFILGGMMLGASALLASRQEAFLTFLIPTGVAPSVRLLIAGDHLHIAMGLLSLVFTGATLATTTRLHRMVASSLRLQMENRDLVEDLKAANQQTAALNQDLERRVEERTGELNRSTEQLRAEIAQREQAEEELLRARKLESVGVLAGGIAHDFNNFLTVVLGNIELAKAQLKSGKPAENFLEHAAKACQRATFLSSQLLTFAKGGAPVRRVVSIAQLVTDAVQLARTGSPVNVDVKIAEGLWLAEVDPGQIGQVLHNILLNARQAMPGGGTIEVRAENVPDPSGGEEPRVRISIRDQGRGIEPEVQGRIFDPYFTTKPGGSGLGLATAYAIVAKHGGQIAVESTQGEGTLFTVHLPAALRGRLPEAVAVSGVEMGTERLLVMDDDDTLLTLFKAVLTQLGYEVQIARDGAEAIALYQASKVEGPGFDAVLLDLTVTGGIGGLEAAALLRQLDPAAKLIVSSGYSDAPVMSDFREYGFNAVIPKPWTVPEMSHVLRRVLMNP
jgi:signal transduction histidine kinase/ActR/RegA family two-component response regulator